MGERTGRRVVGAAGSGPLFPLLAAEIRRRGLPVDLIAADGRDADAILDLASRADVVTIDSESVTGVTVEILGQKSRSLQPPVATLLLLRDQTRLREHLKSKGLPVDESPAAAAIRLSVTVARAAGGEVRCHPAAEALFQDGVLTTTIAPARIDPAVANAAETLAVQALQSLDGIGVFGVEMTLDPKGAILVREVLAGLHPSGHFTIDACRASHAEQHLRAIAGMALGETTLLYSAVTVFLPKSPAGYEGVESVRQIPGCFVHLYGDGGHATVTDVPDAGYRDALIHRSDHVRRMIVPKEMKR